MGLSRLAIGLVIGLSVGVYSANAAQLGTGFTYQGELTVSGAPANGEFDFEFALFDALSGGVETGSTLFLDDVTVTNGVFTVELDFGAGPFAGDQQWVDIAVRNGASTGGFTGLLPRQELTATPYALHAEMVAMDAIGAAELANNAVGASEIQANAVGASEIRAGAVGVSEIQADAVGASAIQADAVGSSEIQADAISASEIQANAVGVSEIQANAVGSSEIIDSQVQRRVIGTCAAGSFSNGVSSDGSMSCAPDQTGIDADGAVAAVLAADGDGSGLDADLLDGQNASQIIDASRVGTEITSLPLTITVPGRYYFTQNLSTDGSSFAAIELLADDVTIDLNGFVLTGASADPTSNFEGGIWVRTGDNARILNGTVRNFGGSGIYRSSATGTQVFGVTVEEVGGNGIDIESGLIDGVLVRAAGNSGIRIREGIVRNSLVTNSTSVGIRCLGPCLVINNVAVDTAGSGIVVSDSGLERDNVVFNNP